MEGSSEKTIGLTTPANLCVTTRPRFRERQVLRAGDLEAEQSYRVAARRRHNIGHHGWGIVSGLELVATHDGLAVQPGIAVDGYGRELIVSEPVAIPPPNAFEELESDALDVWLCYDVVELSVPQRGSWDCGPGQNNNVREVSRVRLTAGIAIAGEYPDPRNPIEVPSADLPFLPHQISPDDATREWPVYLGTIRRKEGKASYDAETPRPYATLTGEVVVAPSGSARMQVGSELETDSRRFAVSVADPAGKFVERLAVDRNGDTILTGNVTLLKRIDGSAAANPADKEITRKIIMTANHAPDASPQTREPLCDDSESAGDGERPGAARMVHFQPLPKTPEAPFPWRIYRTSIKRDGRTIQQLRIEMKHPGDKGDPSLSRIVFGTRANGVFMPNLIVSSDCNVTINGNATVEGEMSEGPILADVFDPRFTTLLAEQWNEGTVIGEVAAAPGTIRVTATDLDNRVIPDATVTLANPARGLTRIGATGPTGEFVVSNLPEGEYRVQVAASGFVTTSDNDVDLAVGGTVNLLFRMTPTPGTIAGIVRGPSGPVGSARVEIENVSTNARRTAVTDTEGRFTFSSVAVATYNVRVVAAGFVTATMPNVVVAAGATVPLTFQLTVATGTIRGSVIDSTGAGVAGVEVVFENLTIGQSTGRGTDGAGQFTLLAMPVGRYRATTNAVGVVFQEGNLVEGGTLNFTLAPPTTATLRGSVAAAPGGPIPNLRVALESASTGLTVRTTDTNDSGNFTFANVEPGTYRIRPNIINTVSDDIVLVAGADRFLTMVIPG